MPTPTTLAGDQLRPLLRFIPRTARFWRTGLLTLALVGAAAVALILLLPRKYRSEAIVYYREGIQWRSDESMSPRRVGQRLKDLLLARSQLVKVVEDLGLFPDLVKAGRLAEAVEEVRRRTEFRFDQSDIFIIAYTGSSPQEAQRVASKLTDILIGENARLRSQQAELARNFLDSEKKRMAAEVADRELEQARFLARHPEFAQERTAAGATMRERQRREDSAIPLASSAAGEGGALGALRREEARLRRLLASPGEAGDPALLAARNQAEARLRDAQRALTDRRNRFTEQHPDVRAAAAQVAEAEANLRRAQEALTASPPTTPPAVLQQRLAELEQEIAGRQPRSGAARAPLVRSETARNIVALETEWARLSREVGEARDRLQALDAQQFTASMTASLLTAGQTAQIVPIDPAYLPASPVGAPMRKRLLGAIAFAVGSAFAAMVLRALLDDLLYDRLDVERLEIAPVLAEVPRRTLHALGAPRGDGLLRLAPASGPGGVPAFSGNGGPEPGAGPRAAPAASPGAVRTGPALLVPSASAAREAIVRAPAMAVVGGMPAPTVLVHRAETEPILDRRVFMATEPDGGAAAAFRILRHRLGSLERVRTILVTSPDAGEGKTLTALNLALALGEGGRARVLLAETNFRTPALARVLGFEPPVCLSVQLESHLLKPSEPWSVVETVAPWLHVAAVSPGASRPLLDGRALAAGVGQLRETGYGYVVLDSSAILSSADANLLEECVDGIIVALRARSSGANALRAAVEQVGARKLLGVVLLGS